jgi:hypothetical protein
LSQSRRQPGNTVKRAILKRRTLGQTTVQSAIVATLMSGLYSGLYPVSCAAIKRPFQTRCVWVSTKTAFATGATQTKVVDPAWTISTPSPAYLRPQKWHPLGDAPPGDGLRERRTLLATTARVARGGCVATPPGRAFGSFRGSRPDRLVVLLFGFGEHTGQKGVEKPIRTRRIRANRERSVIYLWSTKEESPP